MSRSRATRTIDKWRRKVWYTILAPDYFGQIEIGETMTDEPDKLLGRVIETTLFDMTDDFSLIHVKLSFRITQIDGTTAKTVYAGHDYTRDYIRALVRRKSSRIDGIFNVETQDGARLRISCLIMSQRRCNSTQQHLTRKIMEDIVHKKASELHFSQFIQQIVHGKVGSEIYNAAKKVYPLRRVEIRKSKVIRLPPPPPSVETPIAEPVAE